VIYKFYSFFVGLLVGTGIGRISVVAKIYQIITPWFVRNNKVINFESFKIQVISGKRISGVATMLMFKKQYEPTTTQVFKKILSIGDIVVDVGANIGYFTLLSGSIVGNTGQVFSFEPEPNNRKALNDNIALNNFTNIQTYDFALSNRVGTSKFYLSDDDPRHSLIQTDDHSSSMIINVTTLDNIELLNKKQVKLLKTDTEGNELSVLQGSERVIRQSNFINLIVEMNMKAMQSSGSSLKELWDYLHFLDMKVFYLINDYEETIVVCRKVSEIEKACENPDLGINLLCMRKENDYKM
jgi:FkbM family methyltransferase